MNMKNIKYYAIALFLVVAFLSCKKEKQVAQPLSSLNVVNTVVNISKIQVNYFGSAVVYGTYLANINYGANAQYSIPVGSDPITIVAATDTIHPVFNQSINTVAGGIYSLFLCGQSSAVEGVVLQDNIPAVQDSSAGVRFVNLSPNSQPVTINLQGNLATQIEFSGLAYKQVANFKIYPATYKYGTKYTFEIRDAATGTILKTYAWTFRRFFCQTLVIDGLEGTTSGTNAFNVFSVNNF